MLRNNFVLVENEFQYAKSADGTSTEEIQEALEESIKGGFSVNLSCFSFCFFKCCVCHVECSLAISQIKTRFPVSEEIVSSAGLYILVLWYRPRDSTRVFSLARRHGAQPPDLGRRYPKAGSRNVTVLGSGALAVTQYHSCITARVT